MTVSRRSSLAARLLTAYAATVVLILVGLAVLLDRTLEAAFLRDLTGSLRVQAGAVRVALPPDDSALQPAVGSIGQELGLRITVIRPDGVVVADSARDPSTMENHAGRAEVRTAADGRVGVATRTSVTTGRDYRYVALPQETGRIVRVALPLARVEQQLAEVRRPIAVAVALAAVVGVLSVWLVARRLTRPLERLTASVARLGAHPAPVAVEGPAEVALLAETVNQMTSQLDARVDEVRQGRAEREAVLAAMEDGVVVVGPDGQVRYANPAADDLLGGGVPGGLPAASVRHLVEAARDAGSAHATLELELGIPARIVRASAVPLGEDTLLVLRDVTDARHVEAMRRDFVADASHELKTPVAAIRAAAETVEAAVHDDPVAAVRFAAQLRRDAVRLSRIVADLLDLSRLETERTEAEPVRLDRVVAEEVDRLRSQAEDAGVEIGWEGEPITVDGSTKDLALLARNLLDNAVRYTPRGGRVDVRVAGQDATGVLTVTDTGIGIPSREMPRVFERFYRVDRARSRETGGTGLGLSIARHVAEQHGGEIEAESELGRGSTFRVLLPIRHRPARVSAST